MNQDYNDGYEAGARRWAADNDRLRAGLAEFMSLARHNEYEAQKAWAAIARVRELCQQWIALPPRMQEHVWNSWRDEVLRALDGDTQ